MKKFLFILLFALVSIPTQAAEIKAARVNPEKGTLELDVTYGGGCKTHKFDLEMETCLEISPVRCTAKLLHDSNGDLCEAYISRTIEFSLAAYGLTNDYYSDGFLTVTGDFDSEATVVLPK